MKPLTPLGPVLGTILLLAAFLGSGGCGKAPAPEQTAGPAPAHVPAGADRPASTGQDPGFLGVLLPRQSVDVASETEGRIERIAVREGDLVHRGQTVATLDRAQIQRDLEMAQASLRATEAEVSGRKVELEQADNKLSRRLVVPESFPKEEIQQSELAKKAAQANLDAALARAAEQRARVAQVQGGLAKADVKAPAEGRVSRRYLEPGALTGPGQPIVRLISSQDLIVRFAVPPERARSLSASQPVTIEVDGTSLPATIEQISPEVDPPSGMVLMVAVLDPRFQGARGAQPGSAVRVHPVTKEVG
jgi:membrane fusion protein (multidrug efflux system)